MSVFVFYNFLHSPGRLAVEMAGAPSLLQAALHQATAQGITSESCKMSRNTTRQRFKYYPIKKNRLYFIWRSDFVFHFTVGFRRKSLWNRRGCEALCYIAALTARCTEAILVNGSPCKELQPFALYTQYCQYYVLVTGTHTIAERAYQKPRKIITFMDK